MKVDADTGARTADEYGISDAHWDALPARVQRQYVKGPTAVIRWTCIRLAQHLETTGRPAGTDEAFAAALDYLWGAADAMKLLDHPRADFMASYVELVIKPRGYAEIARLVDLGEPAQVRDLKARRGEPSEA